MNFAVKRCINFVNKFKSVDKLSTPDIKGLNFEASTCRNLQISLYSAYAFLILAAAVVLLFLIIRTFKCALSRRTLKKVIVDEFADEDDVPAPPVDLSAK